MVLRTEEENEESAVHSRERVGLKLTETERRNIMRQCRSEAEPKREMMESWKVGSIMYNGKGMGGR